MGGNRKMYNTSLSNKNSSQATTENRELAKDCEGKASAPKTICTQIIVSNKLIIQNGRWLLNTKPTFAEPLFKSINPIELPEDQAEREKKISELHQNAIRCRR